MTSPHVRVVEHDQQVFALQRGDEIRCANIRIVQQPEPQPNGVRHGIESRGAVVPRGVPRRQSAEFDDRDTVAMRLLSPGGHLEGQSRFSYPTWAGERHEPTLSHEFGDLPQIVRTPDQGAVRGSSPSPARPRGCHDRTLRESLHVHATKLFTRIGAEFLAEPAPDLIEDHQRFGLPARMVVHAHQSGVERFTQGVVASQALEASDQLGAIMAAGCSGRDDHCRDQFLLDGREIRIRPWKGAQVLQRKPMKHGERLRGHCL